MPTCEAVKANYTPCALAISPEQHLCGVHRQVVAEKAAKEAARTADNNWALMKASDRTSKAYALMTISSTPGTQKEYTDAKKEEDALKVRVKLDNEKWEKDAMTQKCRNAAAAEMYNHLSSHPADSQCFALVPIAQTRCENGSSGRDNLCDTHRTSLVQSASFIGTSLQTTVVLPFRSYNAAFTTTVLEDIFHKGVRLARLVRFGLAGPPTVPVAPVAAVPAPRRIADAPILTAPVDVAPHVARQHLEMSIALNKPITCPICYDPVTADTIVMTHCGHVYCTPCLMSVRERERKCPQCRVVI